MNSKKFKEFEKQALKTVYSESEGGYHDEIIPQIVERFLPEFQLDPNDTILDIGCGPGVFMESIMRLGYKNCTGVTLSKQDLQACRRKGLVAIKASMTDLPVKDHSIDFIWCRHALEHSPYPLFTLFEFNRVLKPKGQVFIEVPSPDNQRTYMHEFNPNHYSILGSTMWMGLFDKSGFVPFGFWNYDIDLPLDQGIVNEKSFMFAIRKN
jgi:ubiquinone/menaquinone biosynthesis C-methylase UbiE